MRKNELRARSAVKRDLAAIALPTKLQLQKIISELQNLVYSALRTGETTDIEKVCQERLLALLDAGTEVAVLKGGRRGQLSSEKVIDEPISEIMPVRFSLQDKGTVQAQGTAKYLRRISGIDPTRTNNEFRKQNAVLINGLSKEICDTVRKTIVDLTKLGVHVRGGKKEISDILLNAGLDPAATPRLAETIFRTQTAAAYNAGRWNIVNDSDTAPYIWGFQYCTAHDRRVRPEHRLLEGVRLPKDDPFWKRYFPPNGWNCRCTVLEIWNDEETACEDFGITGVDPRKRSPKELNLLPAFDGNAGILASQPSKAPALNTQQVVERHIDWNIQAKNILNQFAMESLNTNIAIDVVCIPFKEERSEQDRRIGWNFVYSGEEYATIRIENDKKIVVRTKDETRVIPRLETAFNLVRKSIAKQHKIKKKEVAIDWRENKQVHQKIIVKIVPNRPIEFDGENSRGENYDIRVFNLSYGNLYVKTDNTIIITLNDSAYLTLQQRTKKYKKKKNEFKDELKARVFLNEIMAIILNRPEEDIEIEFPYRVPKTHPKIIKKRKKEKIEPRHLENLEKSIKIENVEQLLGNEFRIPKKERGTKGELLGDSQTQRYNDLEKHEQLFVDELREAGVDVSLIKKEDYPTPDFVLGGMVTGEVKAVFEYNLGDIITRMKHGIEKQLANWRNKVLLVDTRYGALNDNQVNEIHRTIEESCDKRCLIVYIMKDKIIRRKLNGWITM